MRRIERVALPQRSQNYLARKQAEVDSGQDVAGVWKSARPTRAMAGVKTTLARMSGKRARCMFCEDSRGTDIDHFWPKSRYQLRAFVWENMLLACTGCNRQKGDQFPLDAVGQPLLIDPTNDDPWEHLFYDSHTGNITARIDRQSGSPDPMGSATTDPRILPLNTDPITEGRQRTDRNLRRAVRAFLCGVGPESAGVRPEVKQELLTAVRDNDGYGLTSWYFEKDGEKESPFSDLRVGYPRIWEEIVWQIGHPEGEQWGLIS